MTHETSRLRRSEESLPTLLLVDDDASTRAGLRHVLRKEPCLVCECSGASQALSHMASRPCDLIITDQNMPGMSGTELVAHLSSGYPEVPKLLLTGEATLDLAVEAINRAHVFRFLMKPCPPQTFIENVRAGLSERKRLVAARIDREGITREPSLREGGEIEPPAHEALARVFGPLARVLTARETQIVSLIIAGWRLGQIADSLCLSAHTVRNHLKSSFQKLDVHSQIELLDRTKATL